MVAIAVPREGSRPRVTLRLLPTCSPAMLQLRKLAPGSNAVRSILAAAQPDAAAAAAGGQLEAAPATAPTPHYNASILQVSLFCGQILCAVDGHSHVWLQTLYILQC